MFNWGWSLQRKWCKLSFYIIYSSLKTKLFGKYCLIFNKYWYNAVEKVVTVPSSGYWWRMIWMMTQGAIVMMVALSLGMILASSNCRPSFRLVMHFWAVIGWQSLLNPLSSSHVQTNKNIPSLAEKVARQSSQKLLGREMSIIQNYVDTIKEERRRRWRTPGWSQSCTFVSLLVSALMLVPAEDLDTLIKSPESR